MSIKVHIGFHWLSLNSSIENENGAAESCIHIQPVKFGTALSSLAS
jgi:hypothetical protein